MAAKAKFKEIQSRIPVRVDEVLNYPLPEYNDGVEEDLLRNSSNPNILLTASLAFLQKQLLRRLETPFPHSKNGAVERTYSDLLIFEFTTNKNTQRYFVRVKNIEKYDEIMKREASMPTKTLPLDQILPTPKKMKQVSRRNSVFSFFKNKTPSATIMENPSRKNSFSLLHLFKRNHNEKVCNNLSSNSGSEIVVFGKRPEVSTKTTKYNRNTKTTPNDEALSKIKPRSRLTRTLIKPTQTNSVVKIQSQFLKPVSSDCKFCTDEFVPRKITSVFPIKKSFADYSLNSRVLSKTEMEILKIIPSRSGVFIKKNPSDSSSCGRRKNLECGSGHSNTERKERKYKTARRDSFGYFGSSQSQTASGSSSSSLSSRYHNSGTKILREPMSKLSVCGEESDYDDSSTSGYKSLNLTDEVKSNISSERVEILMRRLLKHFECAVQYDTKKYRKCF